MAAVNVVDNVMNTVCPICNQLFTNPRLLPCAHTICNDCLLQELTSSQQAHCPVCRHTIADLRVHGGNGWMGMVNALPLDLATEALVRSARLLNERHTCDGCRNNASTSICLTCRDRFCAVCADAHLNMTATRHHRVEAKRNVVPEQLAASQPAACSTHTGRPAEFFCQTHRAPVCQLCAPSPGHRACPQVVLLESRVEELRAELALMCNQLRSAETGLERSIGQLDQQLQEAGGQGQRMMDGISADFDRLRNALNASQQRLQQQALVEVTRVTDRVQTTRDTFVARRDGLIIHRDSVDRFRRAMPRQFLNDINPTLRARMNDLDFGAEIPPDVRALSVTPMTVSRRALERLETAINSFGLNRPAVVQHPALPSRMWQFHTNHGQNIMLSNNSRTATRRVSGDYHGVVLSSQPMELNTVYEIRLEEVAGNYDGRWLPCGALLVTPPNSALPHTILQGLDCAVVFSNAVHDRGSHKQDVTLQSALWDVASGTRVGVMLDYAQRLHLYVDGRHVTMVLDLPTTCFAMFDLRKRYRTVTTLPLSTRPNHAA